MKRNNRTETVITTTEYDMRICMSGISSSKLLSVQVNFVPFITESNKGRSTGKERTGYNVPFAFALDIIAAIIVEAATSPVLPSTKIIMNPFMSIMSSPVIRINKTTITRLRAKVSMKLKNSFPRNISDAPAESFNAEDVSFSSSFINTLASPLEAEKNIAIHNKPARTSFDTVSLPTENRMIDMITTTNINNELTAYLLLTSEIRSFLNI